MADLPTDAPPGLLSKVLPFVLLLTALAYVGVLGAAYVWDDLEVVLANDLVALGRLPAMFTSDLWAGTAVGESGFYRPLVLLSFAIDRALGGSPALAHAHSLAWHLAAVFLLGRVLLRTVGPVGTAVGLPLFALHPLQVEAVAWVSARNDPMAAALLLGGLLLLDRERPSLAAGAGLIFAALLSKESALLAPLLLALVAFARTGRPGRLRAHIAVGVAILAYVALRAFADVALPARADPVHLRAAVGPALAFYSKGLLLPLGLAPGLHLAWPPAVPWLALGAVLTLCGLLVGLGGSRAIAGIALAGATLAPALGAVASQGLVADRYLYLPLAGLALAVGAAVPRAPRFAVAGLVLGLVGAVGTALQVQIWQDGVSLWGAAVQRHPSAWSYGVVGRELERTGQPDQAVVWYRRAVAPPKPMAQACWRVAWVSLVRSAPQDALTDGQAALDAGCAPDPELVAPMVAARAMLGQWDQAELEAMQLHDDTTGLGTVVEVAAGARRDDLGPLRVALAAHPELSPEGLYRQVAWLLRGSGEDAAAAAVEEQGRAAGHIAP